MSQKKNKITERKDPPPSMSEEAPVQKSSSFSWKKLALILSPGCIYFFGYCSFRYYLDGIGFSSPQIPFGVGSTYLHAFHCLLFTTDLAVSDFQTTYLKQINDGWLTTFVISAITSVVIMLVGWGVIKNRKNSGEDSISKKQRTDLPNSKFTMKNVFILSGAGILSINFLTFLMLPLLVAILILPTVVLIVPAVLGSKMAADEVKNFSCKRIENRRYLPCATIELRDKSQITGRIYLRNEGVIYVRTAEAAIEIPESDVLRVFRTDLNIAKRAEPNTAPN